MGRAESPFYPSEEVQYLVPDDALRARDAIGENVRMGILMEDQGSLTENIVNDYAMDQLENYRGEGDEHGPSDGRLSDLPVPGKD